MTKLEKDTVIDAVLIFHKLAKTDEEFYDAVEEFRNERAVSDYTRARQKDN